MSSRLLTVFCAPGRYVLEPGGWLHKNAGIKQKVGSFEYTVQVPEWAALELMGFDEPAYICSIEGQRGKSRK